MKLKKLARKIYNRLISPWIKHRSLEHLTKMSDVTDVIDIGVASGTPYLWKQTTGKTLHLIDPIPLNKRAIKHLKDRDYVFYEMAAGQHKGTGTFQIALAEESKSSFYRRIENKNSGPKLIETQVKIDTLDTIMSKPLSDAHSVFGVKIDTEGGELDILKGATNVLSRSYFVLCEVSIRKRFHASYKFEQLIEFMTEQGFYVDGILDAGKDKQGLIGVADFLFLKRE